MNKDQASLAANIIFIEKRWSCSSNLKTQSVFDFSGRTNNVFLTKMDACCRQRSAGAAWLRVSPEAGANTIFTEKRTSFPTLKNHPHFTLKHADGMILNWMPAALQFSLSGE